MAWGADPSRGAERLLSRGPDSNERVLNPISGTKFQQSIEYKPQRTQITQKTQLTQKTQITSEIKKTAEKDTGPLTSPDSELELPIEKINDMRYSDWIISTPLMLLVLSLVLGYENKVDVHFLSFSLVLFFNFLMLVFGYIGEIKLLEIPDKCYDTTTILNVDKLEAP